MTIRSCYIGGIYQKGNIPTTNESNHEALESYFTKYTHVPKETILKQHLLSLGHWFSDTTLDATADALVKSYRLFSYDLVRTSELTRGEHRRVPEHFVILRGPYAMRPVAIQTSLSPYSPYVVDGRLVMTTDGRVLAEVRFPKMPDYYLKSLQGVKAVRDVPRQNVHEISVGGSAPSIPPSAAFWEIWRAPDSCDPKAGRWM